MCVDTKEVSDEREFFDRNDLRGKNVMMKSIFVLHSPI